MKTDLLTKNELARRANLGYTNSGAAIVDALWFNSNLIVGIVLICNPFGVWKAYIGGLQQSFDEENDAKTIAEFGVKLPFELVIAAFPGRFTKEEYDA